MIDCDFTKNLKESCFEIPGGIGINTAYNTFGEKVLCAYIIQTGDDQYRVTDDGDTLFEAFHLYRSDHPRMIKAAEHHARHGEAICLDGEIYATSSKATLRLAYEDFIKACFKAIEYVEESIALKEEDWNIVDQVETLIAQRNEGIEISYNPTIEVLGGKKVTYQLKAGNVCVDTVRPHSSSTGSALRKSVSVTQAGYPQPMIIVDDSEKPKVAEQEAYIISSACQVILFSDLKSHKEPIEALSIEVH